LRDADHSGWNNRKQRGLGENNRAVLGNLAVKRGRAIGQYGKKKEGVHRWNRQETK